jgi:hypothetical protein
LENLGLISFANDFFLDIELNEQNGAAGSADVSRLKSRYLLHRKTQKRRPLKTNKVTMKVITFKVRIAQ